MSPLTSIVNCTTFPVLALGVTVAIGVVDVTEVHAIRLLSGNRICKAGRRAPVTPRSKKVAASSIHFTVMAPPAVSLLPNADIDMTLISVKKGVEPLSSNA